MRCGLMSSVTSASHWVVKMLCLPECFRVKFELKSDTNLFEIVKCKTSVSSIEVLLFAYLFC